MALPAVGQTISGDEFNKTYGVGTTVSADQFQKAGYSMGPTPDQQIKSQMAADAGVPGGPPPPDPLGFLGNVTKGIENVGKSFAGLPGKLKEDIQGAAPGPANENPIAAQSRGNTAIFRGAGDIAQTAFSLVSEAIGAGINTAGNIPALGTSAKGAITGGIKGVSDFIASSPVVQKFAMEHPQAEEDFNRALTLILLAAGGGKVAEAVPEGTLSNAVGAAKVVGSDLVKSPIQMAKTTGSAIAHPIENVAKPGVKVAQNLLMPEIPENVRNAAAKMNTEQIKSLVQAQTENRANAGSFSAMEKVGNTALRDLKTVNAKLSSIGADKSAIMDSAAGRDKVGPIVTKFLQDFNNSVKAKAQLRGDESLVRDIQNQAKLVGNNPTAQAVDRFVDYVQERVYSGSRDLSIPQSEPVEQVARQTVGKLNEALKNKMPEAYRTLNKKYSDMVKVRDEFNNAMGKGGDRSANFIKTLFSPFSARVKKVLPQVQALTGNDLTSQAQVAKHIMDVMGATAQKSLLENQTGLNTPPSSLGKMAFDFGMHKAQQALGGEKAQIQRLLQHANDAHLQSQIMKESAATGNTTNLNTIPRMSRNTGNTAMSTETQKMTPASQNTSAKNGSAGAIDNTIHPSPTGVKSEIGVTSFRGKPVKTVAETKPYFRTPRAKGFENSLNNSGADFGIQVKDVSRVAGSWEGSIEPSFSAKVVGTEADKLAYAVEHAKKANQDAVIMFTKKKGGPGTKDTFRTTNPDVALKQVKKAGISGTTIDGNYISIYDTDGSLRGKIDALKGAKGFEHIDTVAGDVKLIFKDDYAKYERGNNGVGNSVRANDAKPESGDAGGVGPKKKKDSPWWTDQRGMIKNPLARKQAETFNGFTDLTTKLLNDLKGRATVSKQYLLDATNRADLKQPERDLFRGLLKDESGTVDVKKFADRVKAELLPLKRTQSEGEYDMNAGENVYPHGRYESVTLPSELRGPVADYGEHVYESPIKTSGADVHFGGEGIKGYFAHTRIEDLPRQGKWEPKNGPDVSRAIVNRNAPDRHFLHPEGDTRRVIELQSDLFQKGRLEGEFENVGTGANRAAAEKMALEDPKSRVAGVLSREREVAKLEPYRNTWQDRIIREEVKQAAKDGKTKLQFPTGETAMKIEGLGGNEGTNRWWDVTSDPTGRNAVQLKPEDLKVGMPAYDGHSNWIITDVLGDGKFKAVPKEHVSSEINLARQQGQIISDAEALKRLVEANPHFQESFDISGKVDTNNPIYKFYEKEVARYLQKNYGATRVTDPQGVTWNEVQVKPEMKRLPIEAFGLAALMLGNGQDNKK